MFAVCAWSYFNSLVNDGYSSYHLKSCLLLITNRRENEIQTADHLSQMVDMIRWDALSYLPFETNNYI